MAIEVTQVRDAVNGPDVHAAATTPMLARVHLIAGATTLAAFLISGFYLLVHDPAIGELEPALHVMFTSRHIFILAAALIHLLLGSHLRAARSRGTKIWQWVGTTVLVGASGLLMGAFVNEPMAGHSAGPLSRFGLYTLIIGTILHIGTGLRVRDELAAAPDTFEPRSSGMRSRS